MTSALSGALTPSAPLGGELLGLEDSTALASSLRELLLAGERFRHLAAARLRLGVTDTVAVHCLGARGPMTAGDLAEALSLTPGTITALLDRLAAAGLARRTTDLGDRRRVLVMLTDDGVEMAGVTEQWLHAAVESVYARLPAGSTSTVAQLAGALRRDIAERPVKPC